MAKTFIAKRLIYIYWGWRARKLLKKLKRDEKIRLWKLAHPVIESKVKAFVNENFM